MKKIILILIAVGLLWSCVNSNPSSSNSHSIYIISFDTAISGEIMEERSSDSNDGERESYHLDYLALNNLSKKLLTLKLKTKTADSPVRLSFKSTVFTPPPDFIR